MRLFGALILGLMLFSGCEEKLKPSVVNVAKRDIPSQESWESSVIFSDSARVKAVLWAGHISAFAEKQHTVMDESIHVDFFNEQEQHASTLTAERGRVEDRTRDFAAYGNVIVVSDSGTVLKTDSLFWKDATRTIETNSFVDILSKTEHIKGHGLVSDQALKNYRILQVTGEAVVKER